MTAPTLSLLLSVWLGLGDAVLVQQQQLGCLSSQVDLKPFLHIGVSIHQDQTYG